MTRLTVNKRSMIMMQGSMTVLNLSDIILNTANEFMNTLHSQVTKTSKKKHGIEKIKDVGKRKP